MPNYSLVANSTFQPFTYQELAMPLDRQDAYHENLMQQYEQLSDKADILEAMGKNDKDAGAYNRYKAYSDSLRNEAENLYKNGLNVDSRLRLTELRRRYNQEIVPIQNALNKRRQEAELQMKAKMANPALRFTRDASNTSLDDYINNPEGGYGVVNLNNITAQMASLAKNFEKQIQSGAIKKEQVDDFTYNTIIRHGLDPNFINDWLQHPEKSPALTNMMNQVLQANGVTLEALKGSQNGESILRDATSAAQMGAWEAIGQDTSQITPDWKKRQDYQLGQQIYMSNLNARNRMAIAQAKAQASGAAGAGINGMDSVSEYDLPMQGADFSNARDMENAMKTLGYQMKNGKLSSTGKVTIGDKQANVFGRDGRVMTRKQFVAQAGNSEKDQKAFGKYFDKMVDAGKTLGVYGKLYNQKELAHQYNTMRNNSAAGSAHVYALNYEGSDWNSTTKNYPVREIKGYKGGKPVFDTKTATLNDVLNIKDSNKNKANISAYWSNTAGSQGIILTTNVDGENKRFFIDAANIPESNVRKALELFNYAEEYKKAKDYNNAQLATAAALKRLHLGLTTHPKGDDYSPIKRGSYKQQGLEGDYSGYSNYEEED